jgi:hypothetical protein
MRIVATSLTIAGVDIREGVPEKEEEEEEEGRQSTKDDADHHRSLTDCGRIAVRKS